MTAISVTLLRRIKESVDYIRNISSEDPFCGIILGSGLGSFSQEIAFEKEIPFSEIPHFPVSGVEGHKGALLFGRLNEIPVVLMQGRVHYYEGFSMAELTYPVRILRQLGIKALFLTNAAGGINPDFEIGDIMLITDHINMMPNPLIGENDETLGPRFPDMLEAYDKELIHKTVGIAEKKGIRLQKGIYVGVSGPTYETPAEYHFFRVIGGDAVGMSTVPEVIVARQMGLRCMGMSVITDLGVTGKMEYLTHEMVRKAAEKSEPHVAALLTELITLTYKSA